MDKQKAAARGWVTRTATRLRDMCDSYEARKHDTAEISQETMFLMQETLTEFNKRIQKLDDVQEEYTVQLQDEEAISKEIELAEQFASKQFQVKARALRCISTMHQREDKESVSSAGMATAKLPKLE